MFLGFGCLVGDVGVERCIVGMGRGVAGELTRYADDGDSGAVSGFNGGVEGASIVTVSFCDIDMS